MADNDLIFNITAIDHYKAEMDSAFALAQRQAQADQAMINIAKGVESADAARAAAGRDAAEATQQLGNATKDATDAAGKGVEGFESFKGTLVSLQAGISVAKEALGVFKQAWDFAKEGAAIQRIGEQFSNVAESINADSGRLLEGLNKAAHGTVDDEALMQTATRAMALGIASNSDDLIKLMEVARASSVAFGGDTTAAFERISGAVENLAPRALKQSGIIIDLTQAYKDYAEKLHKNSDELTDQEKRQALLNQTLEKGADLVKRIGDQGEDSATKIARFETKAADVMDVVKSGVAGAFIPLLDNLNLLETITNTNVNDLEKFKVGYEALVSNGIDPCARPVRAHF